MDKNFTFETLNDKNKSELVQLMLALWPDCDKEEEINNCSQLIHSKKDYCLLAVNIDKYIGFIHISLRTDYVEGTTTSPVAYIEGIYILPAFRKKGLGNEMIKWIENWASINHCKEIASDTEIKNLNSINFHKSVGFEEVNRIVCFSKKIKLHS